MRTMLPKEVKAKIAMEYQAGARFGDLAKKYNIGTTTLARILKLFGVVASQGRLPGKEDIRRALTIDEESAAVKLYMEGMTADQIAPRLNVSAGTILETLKRKGHKPRRTGMQTMPVELKEKVAELSRRRWADQEIRERYLPLILSIGFKKNTPFTLIVHNKAYTEFRKRIIDRDRGCCVVCRSTRRLHVHHKISRWVRPDLLLDPENVETLCNSCHMKEEARRKRDRDCLPFEVGP